MASRSAIDGPSGVVISVAYFGDAGEGRDGFDRSSTSARRRTVFGRGTTPSCRTCSPACRFGLRNYWSGRFLRELPDAAIELTATHLDDPDATGSVLLEPLHGAAAPTTSRPSDQASRVAVRQAPDALHER
jgi:hypothetical protein